MNNNLIRAIDDLGVAVNSGKKEEMYRCAYELNNLFKSEVPDPFKDYESAWIRFKMAEAMIAFYVVVGEGTNAGTLRNRILAHYQVIRKSKNYTVPQKHELKVIYSRINALIPHVPRSLRYKVDKNTEEYKRKPPINDVY